MRRKTDRPDDDFRSGPKLVRPAKAARDPEWQFGKLDGDLAAAGSATVSIYEWNGTAWADTTRNVTAYAPPLLSSGSIASGKWVKIEWHHQARRWHVTSAEC